MDRFSFWQERSSDSPISRCCMYIRCCATSGCAGRTGRAGNEGEAVSLVCVDEHKLLRDIERLLKGEIPRAVLEGYTPDPGIKAEPIQNGRNGKGRSQPQKQAGGKRGGQKTTSSKSTHKHVHRKSGGNQAKPQHRHSRSGQGRARAAQ